MRSTMVASLGGLVTGVVLWVALAEVGGGVFGPAAGLHAASIVRGGITLAAARSVLDPRSAAPRLRAQSIARSTSVSGIEGLTIDAVDLAEAMLAGATPVVTARGALPEVVGDAGQYIPFGDAAAAAGGVVRGHTPPAAAFGSSRFTYSSVDACGAAAARAAASTAR